MWLPAGTASTPPRSPLLVRCPISQLLSLLATDNSQLLLPQEKYPRSTGSVSPGNAQRLPHTCSMQAHVHPGHSPRWLIDIEVLKPNPLPSRWNSSVVPFKLQSSLCGQAKARLQSRPLFCPASSCARPCFPHSFKFTWELSLNKSLSQESPFHLCLSETHLKLSPFLNATVPSNCKFHPLLTSPPMFCLRCP